MKRPIEAVTPGVMTQAVLRAGLVDQAQLREMQRWNPAIDDQTKPDAGTIAEVVALIDEALQSEGYVLVRETDLEVVRQYVSTNMHGVLHLEVGPEATDIEVSFGKTLLGEYIIAWRSEGIKDAMVNGATYLVEGEQRVFFADVRELFFGEQKVFMVCAPVRVDHVA